MGNIFGRAVEVGPLVEGPMQSADRRATVVAGNVDEQRVVQLAEIFDGLDQTSDLHVRVFRVARIHLHLP
jgi:hypothetical protein